ncbi:C-type lectin domain family 10 member A-like [Mizuhopecten yessoensis]|uniref:C-type lectin domain family 10 member A-like n=1 Tax=Mizuhopecten yessoensis TaxID=6573 RepID=UPI000B459FFC|nr:C-type lectin domain family 10 member A-like [Mizuhopecten yessoensis]
MWVPRFVLGLLMFCSIGRVSGQPSIGLPNLNRYRLSSPSFLGTLLAFAVGYTTNRVLDPSSGEPIDRCPEGWFKRLNRCYFFSEIKASWYGAEAQCRVMGGYLAIPDTLEENNVLKELSRTERVRISPDLAHIPHFARWIGLHTVDSVNIKKIITNETPTFTNFVPPEPSTDLTVDMCVKLDDDTDFTWAVKQCFRTFFYICERSLKHRFTYNI